MKRNTILLLCAIFACNTAFAQSKLVFPRSQAEDKNGYMNAKYWEYWNAEEQARIDADIEKYRKADGELVLENIGRKRDVKIEQVSHEFYFGAHIFNFNQLGKTEYNERYKRSYGELFNSATVPFYWRHLEWERGKPRFETAERDTEEWWNNCKDPQVQWHWRRPSTDQIVDFCEKKGIRMHGHVLVWGTRNHGIPRWWSEMLTPEEFANWKKYFPNQNPVRLKGHEKHTSEWGSMSFEECAAEFPTYLKRLDEAFENRIKQIADRYKGRIDSWDVVNESCEDDRTDRIQENWAISKSRYGIMPGDYPYKALKWAEKHFPSEVKLNINDYRRNPSYPKQVNRLLERGCKIDIMGIQMHLMKVQQCQDIANGVKIQTPSQIRQYINWANQTGLPLHMSEITVTSPTQDEKGFMIQAIIAQQLYRMWFSQEKMMGITWWNTVDGCGLKGEPAVSGIFTRDMQEKPAYWALDQLINHEWKTNTTVKADESGKVQFRGFKGKYRITYKDKHGKTQTVEYILK